MILVSGGIPRAEIGQVKSSSDSGRQMLWSLKIPNFASLQKYPVLLIKRIFFSLRETRRMIRALAHVIALGNMVGWVSPLIVATEATEVHWLGSHHQLLDERPACCWVRTMRWDNSVPTVPQLSRDCTRVLVHVYKNIYSVCLTLCMCMYNCVCVYIYMYVFCGLVK